MPRTSPGSPTSRPRQRGLRIFTLTFLAAVLSFVVSCDSDHRGGPLEPDPSDLPAAPGGPGLAAVHCVADVVGGTIACVAPGASLPPGASGAVTLGGQDIYVRLSSDNVCFEDGCDPDAGAGVFQADVTIRNLIAQALGTTDGENVHEDGVRVYFHSEPAVTATSDGEAGTAEVHDPDGTAAFTAADQPFFQYDEVLAPDSVSAARRWRWLLSPNVRSFEFHVLVWTEVQYPNGWIDVVAGSDRLVLGDGEPPTTTLTATVRNVLGEVVAGAELEDDIVWSSDDEDVVTIDPVSGEVVAVDFGAAVITATAGARTGSIEITVVPPAIVAHDDAPPFTGLVTGNIGINTATLGFSATANDDLNEATTVVFVGWVDGEKVSEGRSEHGASVAMTPSGEGMGTFEYRPAFGFQGTDRFHYVVSDGQSEDTATVTLEVTDIAWVIDNEASECTSVAAECGTYTSPFSTVAAFSAANDGVGSHPGDGQRIFIRPRATSYPGLLTLRDGQVVSGLDLDDPGDTETRARIAGGIALASDNTLIGLRIEATGGPALSGSDFGTLLMPSNDLTVSASGGPAISLSNGSVSGVFRSVSADGGVNGVVLSDISGDFEVAGDGSAGSGGTIRNMTGDAIALTNTGVVRLAWMELRDNGGSAVRGSSVGGFVMRQSTVERNGGAHGDDGHGLSFTQLTGTARLDTVTVRNSHRRNVSVENTSGKLEFEVRGGTFGDEGGPAGGISTTRQGIYLQPGSSATIHATIEGVEFKAHAGPHVDYNSAGTGAGTFVVRGNTMTGGHPNPGSVSSSIEIGAQASWTGSLEYLIENNTIRHARAGSIRVWPIETSSGGVLMGRIRNNVAGGPDENECGTTFLEMSGIHDGVHVAAIHDNSAENCGTSGIWYVSRAGGQSSLTVRNNQLVGAPGIWEGFYLSTAAAGSDSTCLMLEGNKLRHGTEFGAEVYLEFHGPSALQVAGLPAGSVTSAQVSAYLSANNTNPAGDPVTVDIGQLGAEAPKYTGVTSCPLP